MAIDKRALDKLREMVGGEDADLWEIVESFFEEGPAMMKSLLNSSEGNDLVLMRRSAHSIKGNARDLGAVELAEICARIEVISASGAAPDTAEIETARVALEAAIAELRSICRIGV